MYSSINNVYVFDLDGVITNPEDSSVNEAVVTKIYQMLSSGMYAVVNTGRSYDWVESNLVNRLLNHNNPDIFSRFISVCEKGGETVRWVNDIAEVTPSEFALQSEDYAITKDLFENHKVDFTAMFWDDTKRTMATIEKIPEADLGIFHQQQQKLVKLLHEAFNNRDIRIDATTIATDVEQPAAGKYAGAKLIYAWINEIEPNTAHEFVSIGDSVSDYEMARYFAEQKASSTFVYVGKSTDKINHADSVEFIHTVHKFSEGTQEYLDTII